MYHNSIPEFCMAMTSFANQIVFTAQIVGDTEDTLEIVVPGDCCFPDCYSDLGQFLCTLLASEIQRHPCVKSATFTYNRFFIHLRSTNKEALILALPQELEACKKCIRKKGYK